MELDLLLKYSNFIKDRQYLFSEENKINLDKNSVLTYFNKELSNYFDKKSPNYEKFQKLKDEIIVLIFTAHFSGINDHLSSSRLWSYIMKKFLSKIFHYYLSIYHKDYKKNFFVIGLGKIGVSDLNYSSDIDLIIIFDSKNSNISFNDFDKSVKKILSKISNISNSFFHTIDMRLRPDFGNESIISEFDNSIDYYSSIGRNWERLAFHRSSFLCGNYSLFLDFNSSINSFLYRQTFDFYAIDEIKKLFNVSDINSKNINIKTSHGYIRTCENIIHFLQLLWSGKIKSLRNSSIHKLFIELNTQPNIISSKDLLSIKKAYYYYRWIEDLLHIKFNSKQNNLSFENNELLIFEKNYKEKLFDYSTVVISIFDKLFNYENSKPSYDLKVFNKNSSDIIKNWFLRGNNRMSSSQIKNDFDNIINSYLNIISHLTNKDDLVIKFDYLLTYYKSGIHLAALHKYNNGILNELIFIFTNSPKLTNQLNKYNFLVEALIYYFNHGLDHLITKNSTTDDFDIDLKNSINNLYESLFLYDYLFLKSILSFNTYKLQRSRNIRSFINKIFLLVKDKYLKDNKLKNSNIIPVLFGSTALFQNLSYSDSDIYFVQMDKNISHLESIKIVKRFYLIINQYLDKSIVNIDYRNKPFGNNSEIIRSYDDFLNFYRNNNDDFYKFTFYKCDLITNNLLLKKNFKKNKQDIINKFSKIKYSYIKKIFDIKSSSLNVKSLITIYDLITILNKINKTDDVSLVNDLGHLKMFLNNQDLKGVNQSIDISYYLKKINF